MGSLGQPMRWRALCPQFRIGARNFVRSPLSILPPAITRTVFDIYFSCSTVAYTSPLCRIAPLPTPTQ